MVFVICRVIFFTVLVVPGDVFSILTIDENFGRSENSIVELKF